MIRVTIELLSANGKHRDRKLGTLLISNRTNTKTHADYDVALADFDVVADKAGNTGHTWKRAEVLRFHRAKLGGYDLLYRALAALVGYRNPESSDLFKPLLELQERETRNE